MSFTLNRKVLRKFILQEMKKSIIREQSEAQTWQDLDLSGLEITGRPRLQGKYKIVSSGSSIRDAEKNAASIALKLIDEK